jgi:large subunit ribosomal protein L20
MPRARKGAAKAQQRRKILRAARGFYNTRRKHRTQAKITLMRAGRYAWRDRRARRRDFRKLWITRVTAACRMRSTRYSRFMHGLQQAGVGLNRKMLSQIAIEHPAVFDELVTIAATGADAPAPPAPVVTTRRKMPQPQGAATA